MLGRALLALAGLVLIGAAIVQALGTPSVAGWLPGDRGADCHVSRERHHSTHTDREEPR